MELKINLADREEIAAAIPLLQVILDNTTKAPCSGKCHIEGKTWQEAPAPVALAGPSFVVPAQDAAAIFGGAAPLQPGAMPAPFTAAAVASPIAPAAPSASLQIPPAPSLPAAAPGFAANVPMAPVAPSTPAPGVELDTKGLPWDDRIHTSTKSKVVDGSWKMKRGVDVVLVTTVEAELRARVAQTASAPAPAVAAAPAPFVPLVAPLVPAPTVAPSVSADPTTFEQLMPRITAAVMAGSVPATALGQACTASGLASIVALQTNPALVPQVWATMKANYPGAL